MADADLFLIEHPGVGWALSSPQLPELFAGTGTRIELDTYLQEMLRTGGLESGARVRFHEQCFFVTESGEDFAIRAQRDDRYLQRLEIAHAVKLACDDPADNLVAEYGGWGFDPVFVASMYDDHLGPLLQQMDRRGDTVVIATRLPQLAEEIGVVMTSFTINGDRQGAPIELFELTEDSTVGEVFAVMSTERSSHLIAI